MSSILDNLLLSIPTACVGLLMGKLDNEYDDMNSLFFQYTLSMVGYGDDEMKTTVLELTYNYGVTEYTKGDAYGQV